MCNSSLEVGIGWLVVRFVVTRGGRSTSDATDHHEAAADLYNSPSAHASFSHSIVINGDIGDSATTCRRRPMQFRDSISNALGLPSEPLDMGESGYVHALAFTVEYGDLELPITPTPVETERGLVLIDVGPRGSPTPSGSTSRIWAGDSRTSGW